MRHEESSHEKRSTWQFEMTTNLPMVNRQWMAHCAHWDSHRLVIAAVLQLLQQHVWHPQLSGILKCLWNGL